MADLNPGYNKTAQDALLVKQGANVHYNSENKRASTINADHASTSNITQIAQLGKEKSENERAKSDGTAPA